MKSAAIFLILCGIVVTVHGQWNSEWAWGSGVPNPQNRPQPGGRPQTRPQPGGRPQTRPQPGGRPQTLPAPAPAFVPAPAPAPAPGAPPQVDGNGSLIGCPCVSTHETNLVCATDGNTYGNMGKLRCAQRCKAGVELSHLGTCSIANPAPIIPSQ